MLEYGCYFDGNSRVTDRDENVWQLIDRVIGKEAKLGTHRRVRIGKFDPHYISDYVTLDKVRHLDLCCDVKQLAQQLLQMATESHLKVAHVPARLVKDVNWEELERARHVDEILCWAMRNIELSPPEDCRGRYPLPIVRIDGTWHHGATTGMEYSADVRIDIDPKSRAWVCDVDGSEKREYSSLCEAMEKCKNGTQHNAPAAIPTPVAPRKE